MRTWLYLGTALLLGLGTAGGAGAQDAPPAAGQTAPAAPRPGLISLQATASRRLPSTVSDATVSIEVHGRDLRNTAAQLSRQAQGLLGFLRTQNADRLRTEGTSFEPEIQELRGQPDRIKGYTGRMSISFRTAPEQLPLVLAGCLDNGATALGQFGSSPREEEVEAARRDMVAQATRDAMAQAHAIADAAGQKLAGIDRVEVDPLPRADGTGTMSYDRAERAAMRPLPVLPSAAGESSLTVRVVLTLRVSPS